MCWREGGGRCASPNSTRCQSLANPRTVPGVWGAGGRWGDSSPLSPPPQGEKNHGFDVLYHNMKHGQTSTKELADFVRERAAIEESYAKAMVKLSKMATNGTQLGTFAPLWEVFRVSSDKLALCHLELVRKLQELLRELSRYGEEQGRAHKKVLDPPLLHPAPPLAATHCHTAPVPHLP
ncbi:F-BAR domain only protein 1-like, partial [Phasianus colchicus]|uniref:F-BAR domain only protein 1-like n=1 Tax=Phasianus colchicus TaxID=9054 RepID=UPI00129E1319